MQMHVKHKDSNVPVVFILICLVSLSHIVYLTLASRPVVRPANAVYATALKLGITRVQWNTYPCADSCMYSFSIHNSV